MKTGSSNFVNDKRWVKGRFSWQDGYGGFSYSRSQIPAVAQYIENQETHHAKRVLQTRVSGPAEEVRHRIRRAYLLKWIECD